VGDILTVVIEIDDEATISNQTNRSRSGSESASVEALLGLPSIADGILPGGDTLNPGVSLEGNSTSRGQGGVSRAEQITLRVAATVTDVLPNGHLVVYGSQEVRVNFELRDLQVAGVIRPEDISRRNEISYDKIADARVAYGGRGQITDLQQPRYGQQVLDMVLPF
jgi:flagellar L-ring protein precursor FlgH